MPKGGKRPGAGRPKGTTGIQHQATRDKQAMREAIRRYVDKHLDKLMQAQLAHAQGIGHLFTRDKSGKFTRIEDEQAADRLLTQGTEGQDYWIFMKDPSTAAFTDLLNRAVDKPSEHVELTGADAGPIQLSWKK